MILKGKTNQTPRFFTQFQLSCGCVGPNVQSLSVQIQEPGTSIPLALNLKNNGIHVGATFAKNTIFGTHHVMSSTSEDVTLF